jgi:hypothetical protein
MTTTTNYGNYLNCHSPSLKKAINTPISSAKHAKDVKITKIEASPGKFLASQLFRNFRLATKFVWQNLDIFWCY